MLSRRDIRRCALQVLYQLDSGNDDMDAVLQSLSGSPGGEEIHGLGFELACAAWERRAEADKAVADLSPQWPTHRQPVIDRNLLRLAYHEMCENTPPKVVINEALELAKEFSTAKSSLFINGILDKLRKSLEGGAMTTPATEEN